MGLLQGWGRKRMTKGALAALERGDETYTHTLATPLDDIRSRYVTVIESVGWKLTSATENPQTPRTRWTLIFERAETATPQANS